MIPKLKAYTFVSREILHRLSYFFLCFSLCLMSSWIYEKELLFLYLNPLLQLNQNIMFTSISDAFSTSLRVCIWISFSFCLPLGFYQISCFFLPSFFPVEKKIASNITFFVFFFYVFSYILCRVYVIPELSAWFLKFGVSTQGLYLSLQASLSNYVSWSEKVYLICLCVLEIPVLLFILLKFFLDHQKASMFLSQRRKSTSLCILLLSATLSPPDFYSQGLIFIFFTLIIEFFLWYGFLTGALKKTTRKGV